MPSLFWFQNDLRVDDNPALCAAARTGAPVICLYVLDDENAGTAARGAASRFWLHNALADLEKSLAIKGLHLTLRRGKADEVIPELCQNHDVKNVFWNRHYEPWQTRLYERLQSKLDQLGAAVSTHRGNVLVEPWEAKTGTGTPFRVFTPFYKSCLNNGIDAREIPALPPHNKGMQLSESVTLDALELLPRRKPDWHLKMAPYWDMSASAASERIARFLDGAATQYKEARDIPGQDSTSRLSPYLHFGQITARDIWRRASYTGTQTEAFTRQLFWRDFSIHLLHHNPDMQSVGLDRKFDHFPWLDNDAHFTAWKTGQTGYPIVDAGMRQLWETGWMHNRVRMIVASFLVKHLLLPWQWGERWFWDTLVDADMANNSASWQWVAGCGADAAPYFRVFNPFLQGAKFDADGRYVRQWCPELKDLPDKVVHTPWEYDGALDYPPPIIDHGLARNRALEAYDRIKRTAQH